MNVNLISPNENGNSYVVRFKDDIIIPENSKVYLNFASFSRENDVELYEDQTLKLIFKNSDVYPSKIASTFADNTLLANSEFTIPKGTYNYQRLYQLITKGFNDLLTNAGNTSDLAMYKAIAISDIDNTDTQITQGEVSFSLGLMKSNPETVPHKPFEIDGQNFINGDNNTNTDAYQKTTVNQYVGTGLKKSNGSAGFCTSFSNIGTPDKNPGNYTDIVLISTTGVGAGATINFTVDGTGAISFTSVRVIDIGNDYVIGDTLTIPNTGGIGGTADTTFDVETLQNGSGQSIYDNYALSEKHYWHIGYDDETPLENCNIIKFTTKNTLQHMLDNSSAVAIGLYSSEVAKGINGTDGAFPLDSNTRTGGTTPLTPDGIHINPLNLPNEFNTGAKHLGAFVNITIDGRGATPYLKIFVAQSALGINLPGGGVDSTFKTNGLHNWTAPHRKIVKMRNCSLAGAGNGINLTTIQGVDFDNQVSLGLQTYYDVDELNQTVDGAGKLYFRVLNLNGFVDGRKSVSANSIVLYDSKSIGNIDKKSHFPPAFFKPAENIVSLDPTKGGLPADIADYTVDIGTGARTNGTYTDVVLTGGTGNGAKCTIVVAGTAIDAAQIVITSIGDGYTLGDVLNIPVNEIGGNADGTLTVGGTINTEGVVNRINAQLPFNVITSALTQNDGFSHIDMPSYTKSDTKPLAFLVKYEMEASEELSRYLGFNTSVDRAEGLSQELFPNTGDAMNRNLIHLEGMTLDWRNESYSVSIKELPIKNYKNNEFLRNGGFSKPILANCPVPFSDAQSYQTKSKQMITATYKPNYQVLNNLYNQAFTTNTFSVDINKLNSEKPAQEIKKSVINFTILPPDDYKGNLNSISGLNQ